jgi:hypothetical protein
LPLPRDRNCEQAVLIPRIENLPDKQFL